MKPTVTKPSLSLHPKTHASPQDNAILTPYTCHHCLLVCVLLLLLLLLQMMPASTTSDRLSRDVTDASNAADEPLSQLATKMSAGRDLDLTLPQLLPLQIIIIAIVTHEHNNSSTLAGKMVLLFILKTQKNSCYRILFYFIH